MSASMRLSALIAATALLGACGGGGGGSSPTTPSPSGGNPPTNPPPTNPPVNDAEQYKGFLEASLRIVLGVDHIAKTFNQVPAKIKADVEAHGPFTQCQNSTCPDVDTSQWVTFPMIDGGTVRLQNWEGFPANGVLDAEDHVYADFVGIGGGPTVTATAHLYMPGADGALRMSFGANYELTRKGLRLSDNTATEWTGSLLVAPSDGKYEIRDRLATEVDNDRQSIITEYSDSGQTLNVWLTNYVATTNISDLDSVEFNIDMFNYVGGASLKLRTDSPLNFGIVGGTTAIESGRYIYEYQDQTKHYALRVSVDTDPAFLNVEIDEGADGTYEKSGRLPQDDFDYRM